MADGIRELCAEQGEYRNHRVSEQAKNKLAVPCYLSWLSSVEITQDRVAIHLNENPHSDSNKRKYNDPIKEQKLVVRLE